MELDAFHRMYLAATNSAPPRPPSHFLMKGGRENVTDRIRLVRAGKQRRENWSYPNQTYSLRRVRNSTALLYT